jgi:hypothetical protein
MNAKKIQTTLATQMGKPTTDVSFTAEDHARMVSDFERIVVPAIREGIRKIDWDDPLLALKPKP